jgi:hypothetical protein
VPAEPTVTTAEDQGLYADYLAQRKAEEAGVAAPLAPAAAVPADPTVIMRLMGFGGGEATRDPKPTEYDPNDLKDKQQAIHKPEAFADYFARRKEEKVMV